MGLSEWGGCGAPYPQLNFQCWLMECLQVSSLALKVLDKEILSPHLFIMGMEVLDVLIRRAVEGGFLSGCNIKGGSRSPLNISHLFFANDTIVFCEACKEHLTHLS